MYWRYISNMVTASKPIRISELAESHGVTVRTAMRWVTNGNRGRKLKAYRLGGAWYTRQEWIDDFCEASSAEETPSEKQRQKQSIGVVALMNRHGRKDQEWTHTNTTAAN